MNIFDIIQNFRIYVKQKKKNEIWKINGIVNKR